MVSFCVSCLPRGFQVRLTLLECLGELLYNIQISRLHPSLRESQSPGMELINLHM